MDRYSFSHLPHAVLLQAAKTTWTGRSGDTAVFLAQLAEIDARKLYVPEGFESMQRYCEGVINELVARLTRVSGDYSYGPFLIARSLLPRLETIEPRVGWGWRHHAFLSAHRQGRRIVHLTGDYPCPPDQRHEDDAERMHRLAQLSQNILGLIA